MRKKFLLQLQDSICCQSINMNFTSVVAFLQRLDISNLRFLAGRAWNSQSRRVEGGELSPYAVWGS